MARPNLEGLVVGITGPISTLPLCHHMVNDDPMPDYGHWGEDESLGKPLGECQGVLLFSTGAEDWLLFPTGDLVKNGGRPWQEVVDAIVRDGWLATLKNLKTEEARQ